MRRMLWRFFAWVLVGLVCFHPRGKQIWRRGGRSGTWPGQECLACGHWHPFDVLVRDRPALQKTVRPQGERAHLREEAARLQDRLEVLELEQMTGGRVAHQQPLNHRRTM